MDGVETRILQIIDERREEIIAFARDIYTHGELGYKEFGTADKFASCLERLGLTTKKELAVTGVKGYLNPEKRDRMSLALIGELDALAIPNHKHADPVTGAAHCCGHHAQLAGVLGAAFALCDKEVASGLDGQVVFFAVPAEEYGEIEYKNKLKEQGKIRYGGGKCELIRIGEFDDIDISLVHHTGEEDISVGNGSGNGFVSKIIRYRGKAAHAAGSPHLGVNALNAASLGLTALAYQRETFRDEDAVRVHPILTKGGSLVNVVPDEVVIETLVRAAGIDAMVDAAGKTDRAFLAGARALGAGCEITTLPGYLPNLPEEANGEILEAARLAAGSAYRIEKADMHSHTGGSTDVGDLQHVQPVLTFRTGGKVSGLHASDFDIVDEELAYVVTAKIFALSAYRLLKENAAAAVKAKEAYRPVYTREEYIAFMDSMMRTERIDCE